MIDQDRMKHSYAVANKMMQIGKKMNLNKNELEDLFLLGFNHDIGYEFGDNLNHNVVGGKILKQNNYKYWQEIYYHGEINISYKSLFLNILNMADMQIDKYGNEVGYEKRLEDIKTRYGENSNTYTKANKLIDNLKSWCL